MSTPDDPWTIKRLLDWTKEYLRVKGAEDPRLDAEVLLAKALDCDRVRLFMQYDSEVGSADRAAFKTLIRKRAEGEPVAYLVGKKEFFSISLTVNPAVLIPRPDSEYVVVECLAALEGSTAPRVADIGTGSGNLALAIAHVRTDAKVDAVDLSPEALAVARSNADRLGLADRVRFFEGDLLAPIAGEGPFDAIVSNPPYIPTDLIPTLEPGVRDFEPHRALDGGPDGLEIVRRIVDGAPPLLKPGGHLILEIGSDQEGPVRTFVDASSLFELLPTVRDGAGHPRVIKARRASP